MKRERACYFVLRALPAAIIVLGVAPASSASTADAPLRGAEPLTRTKDAAQLYTYSGAQLQGFEALRDDMMTQLSSGQNVPHSFKSAYRELEKATAALKLTWSEEARQPSRFTEEALRENLFLAQEAAQAAADADLGLPARDEHPSAAPLQ